MNHREKEHIVGKVGIDLVCGVVMVEVEVGLDGVLLVSLGMGSRSSMEGPYCCSKSNKLISLAHQEWLAVGNLRVTIYYLCPGLLVFFVFYAKF